MSPLSTTLVFNFKGNKKPRNTTNNSLQYTLKAPKHIQRNWIAHRLKWNFDVIVRLAQFMFDATNHFFLLLRNLYIIPDCRMNEQSVMCKTTNIFFFRKKKKFKFSLQITERESVLMDSMSVACTMQEKWRWRKSENLIYFYVIFSSLFFFLMNFIHGCICAVCSGTSLRREREEGRKKWE